MNAYDKLIGAASAAFEHAALHGVGVGRLTAKWNGDCFEVDYKDCSAEWNLPAYDPFAAQGGAFE